MSATTAVTTRGLPHRPRTPSDLPTPLLAFVSAAIVAAVGLIAIGLWHDHKVLSEAGWGLVAWVGAIALVGLVAVSSESGPQLGLDMPLLLAAGFLFGPAV